MRTNVTESSIKSYDALKAKGMAESRRIIIDFMRPGVRYTRKQIARALDIDTSSVSGRVRELIDMKEIEVSGMMECPISKKNVEAIKLTSEQRALF